ncbi:hypothetical protein B7463_g6762, partial [Scytalidium lignicola]
MEHRRMSQGYSSPRKKSQDLSSPSSRNFTPLSYDTENIPPRTPEKPSFDNISSHMEKVRLGSPRSRTMGGTNLQSPSAKVRMNQPEHSRRISKDLGVSNTPKLQESVDPEPTYLEFSNVIPFYDYDTYRSAFRKRLNEPVTVTYPDAEAFGLAASNPGLHPIPVAHNIISKLMSCNIKNPQFMELQSLAADLKLFGKYGEGILPLGSIGDRKYELLVLGLSQEALNDKYDRISPVVSACFLSDWTARISAPSGAMGYETLRSSILPLGILLINARVVPWIICVDERKVLSILRPSQFDPTEQASKIIIENYRCGPNDLSEAPFSWKEDCPSNGLTWTANDMKRVYRIGGVSNLKTALKNPNQSITIDIHAYLIRWTTSPIWTRPRDPSAKYIISELQKLDFAKCRENNLYAMSDALLEFKMRHMPDDNLFQLGDMNNNHHYAIYIKSFERMSLNNSSKQPQDIKKILYTLDLFRADNSSMSVTAYPLGLLLVNNLPIPWVIFIDHLKTIFVVRLTSMHPADDIRHKYLASPDDDAVAEKLPNFVKIAVKDAHNHDVSNNPFGSRKTGQPPMVHRLGTIESVLVKALDKPKSQLQPKSNPEFDEKVVQYSKLANNIQRSSRHCHEMASFIKTNRDIKEPFYFTSSDT